MAVTATSPYGQGSISGNFDLSDLYAAWDLQTTVNTALSTDLLTATNTAAGLSSGSGAHVAFTSPATIGKYYFEIACTAIGSASNGGIVIAPVGTSYGDLVLSGGAPASGTFLGVNGNIFSGIKICTLLGLTTGDVVGVAADLDSHNVWFRIVAGPDATQIDWNGGLEGNGSNNGIGAGSNPATGILGVALQLGPLVPFITFSGEPNAGDFSYTANFGATPFAIGEAGFAALGNYQLWPTPP